MRFAGGTDFETDAATWFTNVSAESTRSTSSAKNFIWEILKSVVSAEGAPESRNSLTRPVSIMRTRVSISLRATL